MASNALRQRLSLERVCLSRGQGVLCVPAAGRPPAGIQRVGRGWTQSSAPGGDCWPSSHAGTSAGAGGLPTSCWRPGAESITALTCGAGGEAGVWCRSSGILEEQGHDRNMRDSGFLLCTGIADTAAGLLLANYNSSLAEAAQKVQRHTGHWHGPRGGGQGQCSHGSSFPASPNVAVIPSGRVSQPHLVPTLCLTFRPGCAVLSPGSSAQGTPVVLLLALET